MKRIAFVLVFLAGVIACQQENPQVKTEDDLVMTVLEAKFGLYRIDGVSSNQILSNSVLYPKYYSSLDRSKIYTFASKDSDEILIAIDFIGNNRKTLVTRISNSSENIPNILSEVVVDATGYSQENRSGSISFTGAESTNIVSISNGIVQVDEKLDRNGSGLIKDCEGRHGGEGFCQREAGESFSNCYKAEVDEFCDGFAGCAALIMPVVHGVIATACSCTSRGCS